MPALLFDFDGLIADTESAVFQTWTELYAEHGQSLAVEDWAQCVGSDWGAYNPKDELDRRLGRSLDWDSLLPVLKAREAEIVDGLNTLPGVRERLEEAASMGIPCAVGSSSPHSWVDRWLGEFSLEDAFAHVVCLEDNDGRPKPDPGIFQEAARRLEVVPSDCLVFEDSLNGLLAAKAAGMACCVVPNAVTQHFDFKAADLQLKSLADRELGQILETALRPAS